MDIDRRQIHVVNYTENSYIRFGPESWYCWYGQTLEECSFEEEELEQEFQTQQQNYGGTP